ncbi:phage major capsid protein [Brevibacillus laterosporus]|uniref:major capsid protein n=1 Tax=Brevibacillus laterosporus TaxID=1465 RepID=UPI000C78181C|nr:phage major capsid protein [Brevibacillus laterosporus]AUM66380.1 phage major capsid protein [Brevibacillus laterosporus]
MSLTLLEASKLSQDTLQRGVIETFARTSSILELLPFMEIAGNAYAYNQEGALPGIGFRDVNEGYNESTGIINPASEKLYIAGGDVDVDRFIVQTRSNINDVRAIHTEMKAKALSLAITNQFFNGDQAVDAKGFDGLKKRLSGGQVISAGENGANLTQDMIDELIDAVEGDPSALFVSKAMRREFNKLLRESTHYIENGADAFGRPVSTYYGIPIRTVETDQSGNEILGFNETVGTAKDTGSVYAVRFGPEQYVSGLQNGGVSVRDLGELDSKPVFRTRIEWYAGMAVFHPRAAARLKGVIKKPEVRK